ncbi:hypothetical protein IKD82_02845 [Candidatus Saccharibacteria bacterium]|nr:hypothetical protein [Candidatus Saccharibacteria bacterium]
MDQNQTVDNDLQKAIDDITNTTNIDPVFSDPVAAPSSVPEGDTGELGEPVGPFPEPKLEMVTPAPEPIAPLDAMNVPELNTPPLAPTPELPPTNTATPEPPMPEPVLPEPPVSSIPAESSSLNTSQIKTAALRDLTPLINKLTMSASQKFNLYRNIFEELKDYTVLDSAYQAARDISDETERAEALLYLIESIDKM